MVKSLADERFCTGCAYHIPKGNNVCPSCGIKAVGAAGQAYNVADTVVRNALRR